MIPLNEKIWVGIEEGFVYKESKNPTTGEKRCVMKGLMMPRDKVSRNGVLYNWDSVKSKHKELINRPVMYNHQIDAKSDLPLGKFINSFIIEEQSEAPTGFENVYSVPGWYYEAELDVEEKDIIRKLEKGYIRHVSIQLIGESVDEKYSEEFGDYQEAYVGDIIEGSLVNSPGFLDTTCAVMAEAFRKKKSLKEFKVGDDVAISSGEVGQVVDVMEGEPVMMVQVNEEKLEVKKEDVSTTTAAGAIKPTQDLEERNKFDKINKGDKIDVQCRNCGSVIKDYKYNGEPIENDFGHLIFIKNCDRCDKQEYVTPAKEEDVDPKELAAGIKVELEHTDDPEEAKKIALQHLAERPDYYTKLNKYVEGFKVGDAVDVDDKRSGKNIASGSVTKVIGDMIEVDGSKYDGKKYDIFKAESFSEAFKVTFGGPDGHQYFQAFKDENALKKFMTNNPHLMILKKVKERVGADPTQPLMEDEEIEDIVKEFTEIDDEAAKKIVEEVFKEI